MNNILIDKGLLFNSTGIDQILKGEKFWSSIGFKQMHDTEFWYVSNNKIKL